MTPKQMEAMHRERQKLWNELGPVATAYTDAASARRRRLKAAILVELQAAPVKLPGGTTLHLNRDRDGYIECDPFVLGRARTGPRPPCGVPGCPDPLSGGRRVSMARFGMPDTLGCRNCYEAAQRAQRKAAGWVQVKQVKRFAPPPWAVTPADGARLALAEYRRATWGRPKAVLPVAADDADAPEGKTCPGCGTQDLAAFGARKASADGRQLYCKVCRNTRDRRHQARKRRATTCQA
jgi:hypothetical protein